MDSTRSIRGKFVKFVFVRTMMEPLLTAPFGEVSLAAVLQAPDEQVAKARGFEAQNRSLMATWKRIREQRRLRVMAEERGVAIQLGSLDLLLSKQLMYFERYGKLYLSDRSLFHYNYISIEAPQPTPPGCCRAPRRAKTDRANAPAPSVRFVSA